MVEKKEFEKGVRQMIDDKYFATSYLQQGTGVQDFGIVLVQGTYVHSPISLNVFLISIYHEARFRH